MINILIIEELQLVSNSLETAINTFPLFKVVGCLRSVCQDIKTATLYPADVILIDYNSISSYSHDILEKVRTMSLRDHVYTIIFIPDYNDTEILSKSLISSGADCCVTKNISLKNLFSIILDIYNGTINQTDSLLFDYNSSNILLHDSLLQLIFTKREEQVLAFVVNGMTNQEIALSIGLSIGRVRNIVTDLISKCMVNNRTQLAVIAVKNSWYK